MGGEFRGENGQNSGKKEKKEIIEGGGKMCYNEVGQPIGRRTAGQNKKESEQV